MAENYTINTETGFLINNNRVFLPSNTINIFPCSRRGHKGESETLAQYDPEARLNTERTNRLHTALNGFTDRFIINSSFESDNTLKFVLAGYFIEAKNFDPAKIAQDLNLNVSDDVSDDVSGDIIYAHLSLHSDISLSTSGYSTEILYRQSTANNDKNYLDVSYEGRYFFVGVSFTADADTHDDGVTPYSLPLFSRSNNSWELVQASLLPKVEHDTEPDSIKISGNFTVKHGEQTSFKVAEDKTEAEKIDAKEFQLKSIGQVPALELAHLTETDTYQIRFKFGTPIEIT